MNLYRPFIPTEAERMEELATTQTAPVRASDPWEEFEEPDNFGDDEDEMFDCHMGPDGYCGAAGSEWCEFECPYRRGL